MLKKAEAEAFVQAAAAGDVTTFQRFVDVIYDVDCRYQNQTAIYVACKAGHLAIVNVLLKRVGEEQGKLILNPTLQIPYCCFRSSVRFEETPLYVACQQGHGSIVQALLRAGAEIDRNGAEIDRNGFSALHVASQQGHASIVQALLNAGAKVNYLSNPQTGKREETALYVASKEGHTSVVQILLQAGAMVDQRSRDNEGFSIGETALFVACQTGHESIVQTLLLAKADVNILNTPLKRTALHAACIAGNSIDIVKALLEAGVPVNATDANGATALQLLEESKQQQEEHAELGSGNHFKDMSDSCWCKVYHFLYDALNPLTSSDTVMENQSDSRYSQKPRCGKYDGVISLLMSSVR